MMKWGDTYRGRPSWKTFDFSKHKVAHLPLSAGGSYGGSLTTAFPAARSHQKDGKITLENKKKNSDSNTRSKAKIGGEIGSV